MAEDDMGGGMKDEGCGLVIGYWSLIIGYFGCRPAALK